MNEPSITLSTLWWHALQTVLSVYGITMCDQRIATGIQKTLEGLNICTCYWEPSVCWNIFCIYIIYLYIYICIRIYFVFVFCIQIMSFEIVRAKKLFCQKYISFFLFRHCILQNKDNISSNLFKYSFVIASCCDEVSLLVKLICCQIILTASSPGRPVDCSSLAIHLLVLPPLPSGRKRSGVSC